MNIGFNFNRTPLHDLNNGKIAWDSVQEHDDFYAKTEEVLNNANVPEEIIVDEDVEEPGVESQCEFSQPNEKIMNAIDAFIVRHAQTFHNLKSRKYAKVC